MGVPQGFDDDDSQGQWYAHSLALQQYQEELETNQKEIKMSLIVKESGGGGDYKPAPAELAGFDLANILGKPCLLNVVHTEKGERVYANIASVMQVPGGMVVPPQVNPSLFFSLSAFDAAAFESLPDALKEKIKTAPEYQTAVRGEHNQVKADDGSIDTLDDDIPF